MNCPQPQLLQHLLDEALPADQMQTIQAHLELCRACQDTIETLAAGAVTWDKAAQNLSDDQTPLAPALVDAVEKLQGASVRVEQTLSEIAPPAFAEDLSFLQPPQSPGSLGRLEEFEIQSVVGKGGFGIVLKAFDTNLHRIVAIKAMLPHMAANGTARQRFIKEAKAAAAITHDNIVTIHAVNKDAKIPYLAMQFVSGQTLSEKLDKAGPLSVKEILRIAMQIAEGLAAAHKQGLVHRDIKPANILLENGVERVKITDFGLARAVDDASLTQSGTVAGTPMYMSPEQANSEHIDHRSDLFSLGSVLYVMCTGRAPFRASSTMAVLKRVCDDTPTPVQQVNADIPDWLCAIIAKLHAKQPGDRFQTAKEVAEVLGQHLAHIQQPPQTLVAAPSTMDADRADTAMSQPIGTPGRALILWPILYGVFLGSVVGCAIVLTNPAVMGASVWPGVAYCAGAGGFLGALVGMMRWVKALWNLAPGIAAMPKHGTKSDDGNETVASMAAETPVSPGLLSAVRRRVFVYGCILLAFAVVPLVVYTVMDFQWSSRTFFLFAGAGFGALALAGWRFSGQFQRSRWPRSLALATPLCGVLAFGLGAAYLYVWMTFGSQGMIEATWEDRTIQAYLIDADDVPFELTPGQTAFIAEGKYTLKAMKDGEQVFSQPVTSRSGIKQIVEIPEWAVLQYESSDPDVRVKVDDEEWPAKDVNGKRIFERSIRVGKHTYVVADAAGRVLKQDRQLVMGAVSNIVGLDSIIKPSGWVQLFNGKDLSGWWVGIGSKHAWQVTDGTILGQGKFNYLFTTTQAYRDFHLRALVKISDKGDSGIMFRGPIGSNNEGVLQAQILNGTGENGTGSVFRDTTKLLSVPSPAIRPDTWFNFEVIAHDTRIETRVNGELAGVVLDHKMIPGAIGLESGNADTYVRFKKIEIKELPPTPAEMQPSPHINAIGMKLARIPKGTSFLGGGDGKIGTRKVEFPEDFYLGVYEVTQEEWHGLMGANPSGFHHNGSDLVHTTDITKEDLKRFPVEKVSWHDCQEFLARLNKKASEKGWIYRLPTSDEWEYACRGGPPIKKEDLGFHYYFDLPTNALQPDRARFWQADNPIRRTQKVGSFPPNRLGLHDMHGNVDEWCADEIIAFNEKQRVTRGGSWGRPASDCQAQATNHYAPTVNSYTLGFRVARVKANPMPTVGETPPLAVAPLNEQQAKSLQNNWAQHLGVEVEIKNALGMRFRLIPPGEYDRGVDPPENAINHKEVPQHRVVIRKPFYLGVTEVTRGQYDAIVPLKKKRKEPTTDLPVTNISWHDAVQFCALLNDHADEKKAGHTYRLVADAEWEYACRAGTTSPFYFGDIKNILEHAWFVDNSGGKANPVATRKANPWGLHDMMGNVHELCADTFVPYTKAKIEHDPQAPLPFATGRNRSMRSGNFRGTATLMSSSARGEWSPDMATDFVGFRIVMIGGFKE